MVQRQAFVRVRAISYSWGKGFNLATGMLLVYEALSYQCMRP
jgi:hypothetical protein